jgi:hypothetical protein
MGKTWRAIKGFLTHLTKLMALGIGFAGIATRLLQREEGIIAQKHAWMNLTGIIPGILSEMMF